MVANDTGFNWQEVPIIQAKTNCSRLKKSIHLLKNSKEGKYNLATLSDDIIHELGWKEGVTLKLYRSGKMFMLKPNNDGDFVLKAPYNKGRVFRIQSIAFCTTVMAYTQQATWFDAWVDTGAIIFKAKEVQDENN